MAQRAGFRVTLYTERPPAQTTSARAAASFKPTDVAFQAREQRILELSWDEYSRIEVATSDAGVRKHVHWEACSEATPEPWYLDVMDDPSELLERPRVPGGYAFGWRFRTFFIEMPIYLQWLSDQFLAGEGASQVARRFQDLDE